MKRVPSTAFQMRDFDEADAIADVLEDQDVIVSVVAEYLFVAAPPDEARGLVEEARKRVARR